MKRTLATAAVALLAACAPPRANEPMPERYQLDPLLPDPQLELVRARCIAQRLADAANAGGLRSKGQRARVTPDPVAAAPNAFAESRLGLNAEPGLRLEAARAAVQRIRGDWYAAANYSELADMHQRAFALAGDSTKAGLKQLARTEELLQRMAWSQPDLEALYQQAFEARYQGDERCP